MANPPVEIGDVLADKYLVEKVLGCGGMGVVVAARHAQLNHRVAIKFLRDEVLDMPEAVGRFLREARAAVQIKSEHVARVLDVGSLPTGSPFIVVEYLEGCDLASWLTAHGPMAPDQAVDFLLQACQAMDAAHALGIVHRDLKPSNLFVSRRPNGLPLIKVLDFGISKIVPGSVLETSQQALTAPDGTLMGSPLYMSPEQIRDATSVDQRTDIWTLGVILFEMLTGRQPFIGMTVPSVLGRILTDEPPSAQQYRPEVPLGLELVIRKCLEKAPSRRYSQVTELARALAPFGGSQARRSLELMEESEPALASTLAQAQSAPKCSSRSDAPPSPLGQTAGTWVNASMGPSHRWKTRLFLIGSAVVVLSVVALGLGLRWHTQIPLASVAGTPSAESSAGQRVTTEHASLLPASSALVAETPPSPPESPSASAPVSTASARTASSSPVRARASASAAHSVAAPVQAAPSASAPPRRLEDLIETRW